MNCLFIVLSMFMVVCVLDSAATSTTPARRIHHVYWMSKDTKMPVSFVKKAAYNEPACDWLRLSDKRFVSQSVEYYWSYVISRTESDCKLNFFKFNREGHDMLATFVPFQPVPMSYLPPQSSSALSAPGAAVVHMHHTPQQQDLFSFVLLKSKRVDVSVSAYRANATCEVEFLMPWNEDETINNGIRLEIERYAQLKMTLHENGEVRRGAGSDSSRFHPAQLDESPLSPANERTRSPFAPHTNNKRSVETYAVKEDPSTMRVYLSYGPVSVYRAQGADTQLACHLYLLNKDDESLDTFTTFHAKIRGADYIESKAELEAAVAKQSLSESDRMEARRQSQAFASDISEVFKAVNELHHNDLTFFIDTGSAASASALKSSGNSLVGPFTIINMLAVSVLTKMLL